MIHRTKNLSHKIVLLLFILAAIVFVFIMPDFLKELVLESDYSVVLTIIYYLPGFFILIGLIEIWLPEKFVISHLGKHSGVKGSLYSFLLGAIIPGPLYIAFPIAGMLLKKGVSKYNAVVFLSSWACFKFGEEIFELQFLGGKFLLLRVLITIPMIFVMAYIISKIHFYATKEKE